MARLSLYRGQLDVITVAGTFALAIGCVEILAAEGDGWTEEIMPGTR